MGMIYMQDIFLPHYMNSRYLTILKYLAIRGDLFCINRKIIE